jgi:hypothetical protein
MEIDGGAVCFSRTSHFCLVLTDKEEGVEGYGGSTDEIMREDVLYDTRVSCVCVCVCRGGGIAPQCAAPFERRHMQNDGLLFIYIYVYTCACLHEQKRRRSLPPSSHALLSPFVFTTSEGFTPPTARHPSQLRSLRFVNSNYTYLFRGNLCNVTMCLFLAFYNRTVETCALLKKKKMKIKEEQPGKKTQRDAAHSFCCFCFSFSPCAAFFRA